MDDIKHTWNFTNSDIYSIASLIKELKDAGSNIYTRYVGGNVVGECDSLKYNPSKYVLESTRFFLNKYYKSNEKDLPFIIQNWINLIWVINDDQC